MKILWCFILFCFFLSGYCQENDYIVFDNNSKIENIGLKILILEDPNSSKSIEEVSQSEHFKQNNQEVPNFQTTNSSYWVKIPIYNLKKQTNLVLNIPYPIIDHISLFSFHEDENKFDVESISETSSFNNRKYLHQNFMFDLNVEYGHKKVFFLNVSGGEQIILPLEIGNKDDIFMKNLKNDLISGIYFGIMIVMFLYNIFIYFTTKDKNYLYYVIYIFFVTLTQATLNGYTFMYLLPNLPWLASKAVYLSGALVGIGAIQFVREFLKTYKHLLKIDKVFFFLISLYVIAIVLALAGKYNLSYKLIDLCALSGSILIAIAATKLTLRGHREAKFLLIAWSIFLISVCIFVLRSFNIISYNIFTIYALQIGSAVEAVLLSFALADKINTLRKEKEKAQKRELVEKREKEKILEEQKTNLEKEVALATKELVIKNKTLDKTNKTLSTTLNELKNTQTQLIQAEKLASLGQMAAGVAHEINNPMNIINQSLDALNADFVDLKTLIDEYEKLQNDFKDIDTKLQKTKEIRDDIDLDYLYDEIDELIKDAKTGVERTVVIAEELKTFSKLDQGDFIQVNINTEIQSLLDISSANLRHIEVITEFDGLPLIYCNPIKLNQAFLAILKNSILAIEDKLDDFRPKIVISTALVDEEVKIKFEDNGIGMDKETKSKALDPFFTTRKVGSGKGLGLSTAYGILKEHSGKITINSEINNGTKVIISIPVNVM